jgi:hypothetical protein
MDPFGPMNHIEVCCKNLDNKRATEKTPKFLSMQNVRIDPLAADKNNHLSIIAISFAIDES